jgi:hypothetical protein
VRGAVAVLLVAVAGCVGPSGPGAPPPCTPLAESGGIPVSVHVATDVTELQGNDSFIPLGATCVEARAERGGMAAVPVARAVLGEGNATLLVSPGQAFVVARLFVGSDAMRACAYDTSAEADITGPSTVDLRLTPADFHCTAR